MCTSLSAACRVKDCPSLATGAPSAYQQLMPEPPPAETASSNALSDNKRGSGRQEPAASGRGGVGVPGGSRAAQAGGGGTPAGRGRSRPLGRGDEGSPEGSVRPQDGNLIGRHNGTIDCHVWQACQQARSAWNGVQGRDSIMLI